MPTAPGGFMQGGSDVPRFVPSSPDLLFRRAFSDASEDSLTGDAGGVDRGSGRIGGRPGVGGVTLSHSIIVLAWLSFSSSRVVNPSRVAEQIEPLFSLPSNNMMPQKGWTAFAPPSGGGAGTLRDTTHYRCT